MRGTFAGMKRIAGALALAMLPLAGAAAIAQEVDFRELDGEIVSDGSSTVGPITQAIAEEFAKIAPSVRMSVDISGTGGGFFRFCRGETTVQNASREIKAIEAESCAANGIEYVELEVAYDGLTVVVNGSATFMDCMDISALRLLWQKENPATRWSDLDAEWPAQTINLYSPGTDSGTFDYFVDTILEDVDVREDFTPAEDDNVLVEGVANDRNALGYFGHAYYEENRDSLHAVAIDGGNGCIEPTPETIQDGTYAPLSRPLYVYVNAESLREPSVEQFVRFYIANAPDIAAEVGFVGSPAEVYAADLREIEAVVAGNAGTPAP
jgi:phosphate transport system substrate-binding protein